MCGSVVDIQSPTAEIRQGKKKDRRKKPQGKNIMSASAMQGGHKKGMFITYCSVWYHTQWTAEGSVFGAVTFCSFFGLSLKYLWNPWTAFCQSYREDLFGHSLGSMNVNVKGQRSPGTKNTLSTPVTPGSIRMVCARCKQHVPAADGTIPSLPGGVILGACAVYVW